MATVTLAEVWEWRKCKDYYPARIFTRKRLESLFNGRDALTPREIMELPILTENMMDALVAMLPTNEKRAEVACRLAAWANNLLNDDPRVREALATKRAWVNGTATSRDMVIARRAMADLARDADANTRRSFEETDELFATRLHRAYAYQAAREAMRLDSYAAARNAWRRSLDAVGGINSPEFAKQVDYVIATIEN